MTIREMHEKIAQGWTYAEVKMGKGWQAKYPNIASWQGDYSLFGSGGIWKISLMACSALDRSFYCPTTYTFAKKEFSTEDQYQAVDEVIKDWNDEHGVEAIHRFKSGWMGEDNWKVRYPHLARWIEKGKRHCISIEFDLVDQESKAKAWLYDKPTNTETVLFEQQFKNVTEQEVLEMLNDTIGRWVNEHEQL